VLSLPVPDLLVLSLGDSRRLLLPPVTENDNSADNYYEEAHYSDIIKIEHIPSYLSL